MVNGFGGMMPFMGALLGVMIGVSIVLYIYMALALMTVAKKLDHQYPWLAWIPVANLALILQLGNFHWAWVFLIIIPILGWIAVGILGIIATWRIFEKRNYPGWLALIPLVGFIPFIGYLATLANLVVWGFVAWKDR